jgi:hypothetical protein
MPRRILSTATTLGDDDGHAGTAARASATQSPRRSFWRTGSVRGSCSSVVGLVLDLGDHGEHRLTDLVLDRGERRLADVVLDLDRRDGHRGQLADLVLDLGRRDGHRGQLADLVLDLGRRRDHGAS